MSCTIGEPTLVRCKSSTAVSIKGELDDPNGTMVKWLGDKFISEILWFRCPQKSGEVPVIRV